MNNNPRRLAVQLSIVCCFTMQAGWAQTAVPHYRVFNISASTGPTGLAPATVKKAYGFDQLTNQGAGQTIAIVGAFDDPNIEADLGTFNTYYKLTACTTANGCFKKIYATGVKPATDASWSLEMSMDV